MLVWHMGCRCDHKLIFIRPKIPGGFWLTVITQAVLAGAGAASVALGIAGKESLFGVSKWDGAPCPILTEQLLVLEVQIAVRGHKGSEGR